jgi:hypothetical protein
MGRRPVGTTLATFTIDDHLWREFLRVTRMEGTRASIVLRTAIQRYLKTHAKDEGEPT